MNQLPKEQQEQTHRLMRVAFRLSSAQEGEKRPEQIARQLEYDYSSAARSLREGMKEMLTLQRLKTPASLHKCLATTNLIESPHRGVRRRTRNVCRWRDADMAERWVASAGCSPRSTSAISTGTGTFGLWTTCWNVKSPRPRKKRWRKMIPAAYCQPSTTPGNALVKLRSNLQVKVLSGQSRSGQAGTESCRHHGNGMSEA